MDISVILAVYGAEKYIEKCLQSLFNQTKTDGVEFILVNDCTPDDSIIVAQKVISQYPNLSIKVINHEVNRGVAVARQTGIDAAQGEYTIHIDPDDWCELTMLEELYNTAKSSKADIVCCDYYNSYVNNENYISVEQIDEPNCIIDKILRRNSLPVLWNKLISLSLYCENNIRFIEGVNFGEDALVLIKLLHYTKGVSYISNAYVHYRQRHSSIVNSNVSIENVYSVYTNFYNCVEPILVECDTISLFNTAVCHRKIHDKFHFIRFSKGDCQRKYAKSFSEVDKYILNKSCSNLSFTQRLLLYLSSKGLLVFMNVYICITTLLRRSRVVANNSKNQLY